MRNKTRIIRNSILLAIDFLVLFSSLLLSRWFVLGSLEFSLRYLLANIFIAFCGMGMLCLCNVYKVRIVESSVELVVRIVLGIFITTLIGVVAYSFQEQFGFGLYLRYLVVFFITAFCAVCGYRFLYRIIRQRNGLLATLKKGESKSAIIYGAGEIGQTLAQQYLKGKLDYRIIGFIDDAAKYQGTLIKNIPVLGTINDAEKVLKKKRPEFFIVAITTLSAENMHKAIDVAKNTNAKLLVIPSLFELPKNKISDQISLRSLNLEDLLGRRLIQIDKKPIENMVHDKVVLVTGAGGSIGSEICKQLLSFEPKQLLLLDIDETELHDLSLRLHDYKQEFSRKIFPICCDIKNKQKIEHVFECFKPEIVFHAAAYKHVPMMEYYPEEAIRTNVKGSYNVLSSACKNNVQKVIVISTDKAVNPTNVMGATKRFVELEASLLNNVNTEIVCVRFGNVLGSRGSMLPLFLEQIKEGKPITVTHKDIIRYFMAIPEAVSLVFLAGAMAKGGEVMVLDMGEPVKIYDFATRLVKYFGDGRSQVIVTGLRPGEKLYEELLANKDLTIPTENSKVFKAKVTTGTIEKEWLEKMLETIETDSVDKLLQSLETAVPEFHYQGKAPLADLLK